MKKYLIACFLVISSFISLNAQSVLEKWEGVYEGEMIVGFTERSNDTVDVKFELLPLKDSTWSYKMTYLSKTYGEIIKDYEIHWNGGTDFMLDEKDGILIGMSLMNDCFYDMFEVMDRLYATTLRKIGDNIQFDLFTSSMKEKMITNSEKDENGNSYEVSSYKPTQHQTVILTRVSTE